MKKILAILMLMVAFGFPLIASATTNKAVLAFATRAALNHSWHLFEAGGEHSVPAAVVLLVKGDHAVVMVKIQNYSFYTALDHQLISGSGVERVILTKKWGTWWLSAVVIRQSAHFRGQYRIPFAVGQMPVFMPQSSPPSAKGRATFKSAAKRMMYLGHLIYPGHIDKVQLHPSGNAVFVEFKYRPVVTVNGKTVTGPAGTATLTSVYVNGSWWVTYQSFNAQEGWRHVGQLRLPIGK